MIHSMQRKDKEVTDMKVINDIIHKAEVCRLGLSYEDMPYVVPVCFGYRDRAIFFHSAGQGKKVDMIKKNNRVCFEFDVDHELVESDQPCHWGMRFRSVIGFGRAFFLENRDEKEKALNIIMEKYANSPFRFPAQTLDRTRVVKIDIEQIEGKISGY